MQSSAASFRRRRKKGSETPSFVLRQRVPAAAAAAPRARRRPAGWLLILTLTAACTPPQSVEQQVIAVILDMEARIEAMERRPFMRHVASDFTAQEGQLNREQFNALLLYHMRRYPRFNAQLLPIQVSPQSPVSATARFRVVLTGGEGWLPQTGQIFDVETAWRREQEDWLLVSAEWRPVRIEAPRR